MEIRDRIAHILKAEKLSASLFADKIGVQRSSISHVLSGRNKPSLDYLQKILHSFPVYSAEWLVMGIGEPNRGQISPNRDLFNPTDKKSPVEPELPPKTPFFKAPDKLEEVSTLAKQPEITPKPSVPIGEDKAIDKVIILYTDGSFKSYTPE